MFDINIDDIDNIDVDNIDTEMFITISISLNHFRVKNSITIRNIKNLKNNNLCKEDGFNNLKFPFLLICLLRCFFSCNFIFFKNHYFLLSVLFSFDNFF